MLNLAPTVIPQSFEVLKFMVENGAMLVATGFVGLFMLIVAVFFFNALRKLDLSTLFLSEANDGRVSSTKFWTSIAYFVSTIAFLVANFIAPVGATLEFIWLIYLSTVAGHASFSKWIANRGSGGNASGTNTEVTAPPDTTVNVEVKNK